MPTITGTNGAGLASETKVEKTRLLGQLGSSSQAVAKMDESQIMHMLKSDYTWEQIIYKIIGFEGLDPWDLDLVRLSGAFMKYITSLKEMNFRVPAKYIIIAAVLLRMKSDHLKIIEIVNQEPETLHLEGEQVTNGHQIQKVDVEPLEVPANRFAHRQVMVSELIAALQKVMSTEERKNQRFEKRRGLVKIEEEDITTRIEKVYSSISALLDKIQGGEVAFSALVGSWTRKDILSHFLPMLHLDHQRKIQCRQDELFEEIFISRPGLAQKANSAVQGQANPAK